LRWARNVAGTEQIKNSYKILVGNPEAKRPFERNRHRRKCNIRLYPREIDWKSVCWMHLAQDRKNWWAVVNTVMNLRVP
jgi:hypothetical protein